MIKKLKLARSINLVLLGGLALSQAAYAETRADAMGGAGISNGHYSQAGSINPALMAHFTDKDHIGLLFPSIGGMLADNDKLYDKIDAFQDSYDSLETLLDRAQHQGVTEEELEQARQNLVRDLNQVKGYVDLQAEVYSQLSIPMNWLSLGVYIKAKPHVLGGIQTDPTDAQLILNADNSDVLNDLQSAGYVVGFMNSELGLLLAKKFELGAGELAIGLAPKFQRLDSFAYSTTLKQFDEDDFDSKNYSQEKTNINVDFGLTYTAGNWSVGVSARDLIKNDLESVPFYGLNHLGEVDYLLKDQYLTYEFKPKISAGFGYASSFFKLSADLDLQAHNYLNLDDLSQKVLLGETVQHQWAKAGAELNIFKTIQLRAGYQHDLKDNFKDVITAGVGLTPFGKFHLDLAVRYADDSNFGAGIQFGFTF